MTDDELDKTMTQALRSLNETKEGFKRIYQSIDETGCPICAVGKQITKMDIDSIEETRKFLIEKSRDTDRDERIIAATKALGVAFLLSSKAAAMKEMAVTAHNCFDALAEARVKQVINGPEGQNIKKSIEEVLKEVGFSNHEFDPKKVN